MPLRFDEINRLNPYNYMDEELWAFRKILVRRFHRIRISKSLFRTVNAVYEFLYGKSKKMYLKLAKRYYKIAGGTKKEPDDEWLQEWLEDFDPVTEYQYNPEWIRKKNRTFEAVKSCMDGSKSPSKTIKRAEALLNQQVTQKSIEIVDGAVIKAYEDRGITKVKWRAFLDNKTCAECEERNGKIFDIHNLPDKHYNCRCWLEAYEDRR